MDRTKESFYRLCVGGGKMHPLFRKEDALSQRDQRSTQDDKPSVARAKTEATRTRVDLALEYMMGFKLQTSRAVLQGIDRPKPNARFYVMELRNTSQPSRRKHGSVILRKELF